MTERTCKTCSYRFYGNPNKKLNFASWYCRKVNKQPVLIGSDADMKKTNGCKWWTK